MFACIKWLIVAFFVALFSSHIEKVISGRLWLAIQETDFLLTGFDLAWFWDSAFDWYLAQKM